MKLNLKLVGSGDDAANEGAIITCEGRQKVPGRQSPGVDEYNCCRLMKAIDKDGNTDCNKLIAYWMMEGFLGQVDSVAEAYRKGHALFMKLKYEKMPRLEIHAKQRLNDFASMTTAERYRTIGEFNKGYFYSTIGVGFVDVFDFGQHETPDIGTLVPDNGVLKTDILKEEERRCKCLLLDGNKMGRDVLGHFNEKLQCFAYFDPKPNLLQCSLPVLINLSVLILRGCAFLEEIDACLGKMSNLTILEISGASSIKTIPDIFKELSKLRSLNLSDLAIKSFPKYSFPKLVNLRWLILRGCSSLTELPSTRDMENLEVIDLNGAKSLKKLTTTDFRKRQIKMLDLSHTRVDRVPCLYNRDANSSTVTHLFLRGCSEMRVFDIVGKLTTLQVLDLSGAEHLKKIEIKSLKSLLVLDLSGTAVDSLPTDCFQELSKLTDLNLSNTKISSMPNSCYLSSLQVLDVSGCKELKGLGEIPSGKWPSLLSLNLSSTSIDKFTVLNSSDASSSHSHLEHLQYLNLSNTCIEDLQSMSQLISQLKSLTQLLLAGCSELASVLDLEGLTKLEVLDLSGTTIGKEVLSKAPSSLRKLLLKGCSFVKGPLQLASLTLLQELDLRGCGVAEVPEHIRERMADLNFLGLPREIRVTRVDWIRIKDRLPKEIFWDQPADIFESLNVVINNGIADSMSAKPSKDDGLFHLVDIQGSWEAYLKQFHFSVTEENRETEISFDGVGLVFQGHHPLGRKDPCIKPQYPTVEIHGLSSFAEEINRSLEKAVNVALVDISFISSLSDKCFQCMKAMKVCWINNCISMEYVVKGKVQDGGVFQGLETLVLSNLATLKAFCADSTDVPTQIIESLMHIYIDCCPILNNIISSSHLRLNLETLHIKFCDKLEVVCSENELPKLQELRLLGLPELKQIGAGLTSLKTLIISQCPKLDNLGNILQHARSTLTWLRLDSCPLLKNVFSTSELPQSIEKLEIRSCDELTAVFDSAVPSSSISSPSLRSLCHLQLWNLPKLKSIGGDFPSLEACKIKYCSRLPRHLWPQEKTQAR